MTKAMIAVLLLVVAAASAMANEPDVETSLAFGPATTSSATLLVVPDGSGPGFAACRNANGQIVDGTIRVQLLDSALLPVAGFPAEMMRLVWLTGNMAVCGSDVFADEDTDADGRSLWSAPLHAGGSNTYLCLVEVHWPWGFSAMATNSGFGLRINSPDINGDLMVNLSDVSLFAADFFGPYAFRSDLARDNVINLSDIAVLAAHLGAGCP